MSVRSLRLVLTLVLVSFWASWMDVVRLRPQLLERLSFAAHDNSVLEEPSYDKAHHHQNNDDIAWVSYPRITNSTSLLCTSSSWKNRSKAITKYAPRFFLGGGKAGSSAVWYMLKHGTPFFDSTGNKIPHDGYHNSSDYYAFAQENEGRPFKATSGKELCFGSRNYPRTIEQYESLFRPSSNVTRFGLDGCPQGTDKDRLCALWRLFPCEIKFLMLVRDPADRALSWFNDKSSGGPGGAVGDPEVWTRWKVKTDRNFQLGDILNDALTGCNIDPRAILVVDTDGMKDPEAVQTIMDAINEHFGLPERMKHYIKIRNNAKEGSTRHSTAKMRPETMAAIRNDLKFQTNTFLSLLEHPYRILRRT